MNLAINLSVLTKPYIYMIYKNVQQVGSCLSEQTSWNVSCTVINCHHMWKVNCSHSKLSRVSPWWKMPQKFKYKLHWNIICTLWWTNIAMENHHFSWENPLCLWPFSIAMLVYQRVSVIKHMMKHIESPYFSDKPHVLVFESVLFLKCPMFIS